MADWRQALEAAVIESSFKRVRDGYVFRYSPWNPFGIALAGPSRYFRIGESKKAEIAAALLLAGRKTRTVGPFWGGLAIVVVVAGTIWLFENDYSRALLAPLVILALVPLHLQSHFFYVRTLRPLLDGLPRAAAAMTFRERSEKFAAWAPISILLCRLAVFAGICVLLLISLIRQIFAGDGMAALMIGVPGGAFAALAIYYSWLMILRMASGSSMARSDFAKMQ